MKNPAFILHVSCMLRAFSGKKISKKCHKTSICFGLCDWFHSAGVDDEISMLLLLIMMIQMMMAMTKKMMMLMTKYVCCC